MKKYIAAIDCGTSTIKAAIFGLNGEMISLTESECPCVFLPDNRIEQNPAIIIRTALHSLKMAVKKASLDPGQILSVSVSNQRATLICLDAKGRPLGNAISWQDLRGKTEIEALREKITDRNYYRITGLPNNPVFTLAKILWLKRHDPKRYKKTARFVLVHDYLMKCLGCEDYFVDHANASLTGMLDLSKLKWSPVILKLAGLNSGKLSRLVPSGQRIGAVSSEAAGKCALNPGTAIIAGGGDQQCAGIGAGSVEPGIVEMTLGTAGVLLTHSDKIINDPQRRITCCAHALPGKWEVEGLQNSAVSSLNWLKHVIFGKKDFPLGFFKKIAMIKPGANGIVFYPYLAGASAPYWNQEAKGVFLGLTLAHDKEDLVRSIMEGVSIETRQILDVFRSLRIPVKEIRLTGGGSNNETWNQIQADIFGLPVLTLANTEAALLGAAILAAYGAGAYNTIKDAARRMVKIKKKYLPNMKNSILYKDIKLVYADAYDALSGAFSRLKREER